MTPKNNSLQSSGRRTLTATLSMAALVLGASQAQAASINFMAPTTFTDTSVLDLPLSLPGYTGQTYVQGQNFGDNNSKTVVTVGGQSLFINDSSEFNSAPTGTASAVFWGGTEWNGSLFAGDTGNTPFNDILDGQSWATSQPTNRQTVRIGGLTVGQTYIVQLFFADQRGGSAGRTQFASDAITGGNNSAEFSPFSPTSLIGVFSASDVYQDVFLFPGLTSAAPNDTTVAAFTLYSASAIPEPSTSAACVGAFALGVVALRRRRTTSV